MAAEKDPQTGLNSPQLSKTTKNETSQTSGENSRSRHTDRQTHVMLHRSCGQQAIQPWNASGGPGRLVHRVLLFCAPVRAMSMDVNKCRSYQCERAVLSIVRL
uniref:Uncharacterized protein n=1 Tax=Panagrellus redivivus TaxID=6233 RepID=A0A7E4VSG3_PANRE